MAGQAADEPEQLSAGSHTPADDRQTVPLAANPFGGQSAAEPVQVSATSHAPTAERQVCVLGAKPFGGQTPDVPVQFSATSHGPTDARHASVRWTVRIRSCVANLCFNLCKLGASVVGYYSDFYGPLLDGVNGAGASDRVLLHWDLASPRAVAAADQPPLEPEVRPGAVIVSPGADGSPLTAPSGAETLLVWIPDDIVELRQSDPGQADAWREAVRLAIGGAVADGYRGEAITRDGWLLLTR